MSEAPMNEGPMNEAPMSAPSSEERPRGNRALALAPLAVFLALSALFLVRLFAGDASRIPSALIGKQIPTFQLPALEGASVPGFDDKALRSGQPTVVNVFASWCGPCHLEHPVLAALKAKGVRLVGIGYKDEPENLRRFLGEGGNPYSAIGVDKSGRVAIDFGVYGVPETFVVRGDGVIAYKFTGPLSPQDVEKILLPELEKASKG